MKRLLFALIALFIFIPCLVVAQETPSPSVGVPVPDASIATQSDATSLEVNPAGLGYLRGINAGYGFFLPTSDYQGIAPSGHSLNLALGSRFLSLGTGVQWVDNPQLNSAFPDRSVRDFTKVSVGTAFSPVRFFSFGTSVNFFSSRTDERLNDLRTIDAGFQWRAAESVGFGLMARDIQPAFMEEDDALPLRLGVGMALRAFEGRLVLDTEVHHVQESAQFQLQPRISAEPLSGIRLFGHSRFNLPMPNEDVETGLDGVSVGMELSLAALGAQVGTQGAVRLGTSQNDGFDTTGTAFRLWTGSEEKRSLVSPGGRWIRLQLDESIVEQVAIGLMAAPTRSFLNLINSIDAITEDPTVDGIVLEVGRFDLGYAQLWELHDAMERFHEAGKESVAIIDAETPTTNIIYAASAADEVWMRPNSPYLPTGLHVEFTSYAGLFDQLGIEAEFMRIGDYKSAPEAFVAPGPSEPALAQTNQYLDTLYAEITDRIGSRRGLSGDEVREVFDETPIYPADALERGLVDALLYGEELEEKLNRHTESPAGLESRYRRRRVADERWTGRPEIAVAYVDGTIIDGQSGATPFGGGMITGSDTLTAQLKRLERNPNVKAVVLRINSPGGSATASDQIYRALRNLALTKPVIASMGNVAASGGYYVAAGADEIFATPVTLTGSIGIFAGKFNFQELSERFGVTTTPERRGDRAGLFSAWRPWSETEREAIAEFLDFYYQLFLQQVANTRPLTEEEVDEVGRGRIWTGQAAEQQQLVDTTGGITDAIRRAEELAGLAPGEAIYTDRTGAGSTAFSPGMATRLNAILDMLGYGGASKADLPKGQITNALEQMESALIWPMYFESGEAVFLPSHHITFH